MIRAGGRWVEGVCDLSLASWPALDLIGFQELGVGREAHPTRDVQAPIIGSIDRLIN